VRAREPDDEGFVERDGVKVHYEVHGDGPVDVVLLPTWSVVHARIWKAQVPYLSRRARVIVVEGRGNGRSDRPQDPAAYAEEEFAADALAVMDQVGVGAAVLVSLSRGSQRALLLAAEHHERVLGAVFLAPGLPTTPPDPDVVDEPFDVPLSTDEGWAKFNAAYWQRDYRGFLDFFFDRCFTEPHSTKQQEDAVGWALETDPDTLIATVLAPDLDHQRVLELTAQVRCPVLVIHGDGDAIIPHSVGEALAALTGGDLLTVRGGGHGPQGRDPVMVNLALADFLDRVRPPGARRRVWTRGRSRPRRALYVSSPIGLGHAQRDVAIARHLRDLKPDLQIDWLAQHPVTRVLEDAAERVHPASHLLANESEHIESESAEHDLHCFQAYRRMDEILVANFMVLCDVLRDEHYDLVIGDEAWDLDYFLHENPELKRGPYAWLTDFVGWVPLPDGGPREAHLTADYNAEMLEQIDRYPYLRDRSIFVGNSDDVIPGTFGADLPEIRDWVDGHYDYAGYVTGFDPAALGGRDELRAELGYRPDEQVCLVTVGGSGVGGHLLRRVMAAYPAARAALPHLRMVVVTGPRIQPSTLPSYDGLEVRPYVSGLYRHLAACDLAVVQGGLTTSMELTAAGRPFLYFPLKHHFEQQVHVRHRLANYRAGRCMDYDTATPDDIAAAIAREMGREAQYRPVETDGAQRAAAMLSELL
jgi:pimeloyl-ACP methyl ester carboxylesterase